MELPDDVLQLIREYAQPITRPDWRTLHKMTNLNFHLAIARELNFTCPNSVYKLIMHPQSNYLYNLTYHHFPYVEFIYDIRTWERYYVVPK